MATIEERLDEVLLSEGGFQKMPDDNGNWTGGKKGKGKLIGTNKGITPKALANFRKVDVSTITEDDIKNITDEEARNLYKQEYYYGPKIDKLPLELQGSVLDMAITSGPGRAIKLLQKAAGVEADGVIGDKTIEVAQNVNLNNYADARQGYYNQIVEKNPSQKKFAKGWENRVNKYRTTEADQQVAVAPPPFGIDPSDTSAIKSIQQISGLSGKDVDGVWGPQSAKAYAQHARGDYAQIDPRRVDTPKPAPEPETYTPIRNYAAEDLVYNSPRMIQPIRPLERTYEYNTMEDLLMDKGLMNPLLK